jgi:ADP-dependent NAD(P)H-hydrate dehydratase / NAD(P)H-hydrate epimerase
LGTSRLIPERRIKIIIPNLKSVLSTYNRRDMEIVSVTQMRFLEAEANARGVSYAAMMQTAGSGVARAAIRFSPTGSARTVTGLVGSGNNGGDALVALTEMKKAGWTAYAYLVRPRQANDPLLAALIQSGIRVINSSSDTDFDTLNGLLRQSSLLLDGVLGTGITLPLRPEIARVLAHINSLSPLPLVVAVDCPSGVDCDSGSAAPETIPARLTVCMQAVKQGLVKMPAFGLVGEIQIVDLHLPDALPTTADIHTRLVDRDMLVKALPQRSLEAHKGTFGTLAIVAGCLSYPGAALLAGRAAYRTGTGVVQMAVPAPLQVMLAGQLPEAIWLPLPDENGSHCPAGLDVLVNFIQRPTCLLLGPGFGQHPAAAQFIRALLDSRYLQDKQIPLVLDADALRLVAQLPGWPDLLPPLTILTPHPGEMAALSGMSTTEIQRDRLSTAAHFAHQWGHILILKGALSIIASPSGETAVIPVATPALAHAGTGDVLAGMVAGLRAQKMAAFEAAWSAAYLHGQAGLLAAAQVGAAASVMAGDVSCHIAPAIAELYK